VFAVCLLTVRQSGGCVRGTENHVVIFKEREHLAAEQIQLHKCVVQLCGGSACRQIGAAVACLGKDSCSQPFERGIEDGIGNVGCTLDAGRPPLFHLKHGGGERL